MTLYHATPADNVPGILARGLRPDCSGFGAGTARVHLSDTPERFVDFVRVLYGIRDVAVFAVETEGLRLEPGDDDVEYEFAVSEPIPPTRLRLLP